MQVFLFLKMSTRNLPGKRPLEKLLTFLCSYQISQGALARESTEFVNILKDILVNSFVLSTDSSV